jgi:hypothetical protein
MRSLIRRLRRSHTAAAAYTALVLALGGTAYAAATITGEDIVDETIQSQDIGPQAVGTDELGLSAVTSERLAHNSVSTTKVRDGSLTGHDLSIDVKTVRAFSNEPGMNNYYSREARVACPRDYTLLGGGAKIHLTPNAPADLRTAEESYDLVESSPRIYVTSPYEQLGWTARAVADNFQYVDPENFSVEVFARCALL